MKEIYDPEIQSIKDSQSNFETKLNGDFDTLRQDLTSQFTQLQETITNNFNALKQEINTNLPVQVEQEVNKQLDALPTIEYINTIFLKGQVAFFKSNVELQDFTTKHNLQENVDYKLLEQQVIGVSPTGTPFGDSLIKMNQTPQ
ncbi:hypothetical protein, partial [Clostridium sp.]|uniref:hypothetical protein n=1 Tax=Clostridium sp. TaxID=1506 RepID=UPI002606836C